jgi:hypothetical protein
VDIPVRWYRYRWTKANHPNPAFERVTRDYICFALRLSLQAPARHHGTPRWHGTYPHSTITYLHALSPDLTYAELQGKKNNERHRTKGCNQKTLITVFSFGPGTSLYLLMKQKLSHNYSMPFLYVNSWLFEAWNGACGMPKNRSHWEKNAKEECKALAVSTGIIWINLALLRLYNILELVVTQSICCGRLTICPLSPSLLTSMDVRAEYLSEIHVNLSIWETSFFGIPSNWLGLGQLLFFEWDWFSWK